MTRTTEKVATRKADNASRRAERKERYEAVREARAAREKKWVRKGKAAAEQAAAEQAAAEQPEKDEAETLTPVTQAIREVEKLDLQLDQDSEQLNMIMRRIWFESPDEFMEGLDPKGDNFQAAISALVARLPPSVIGQLILDLDPENKSLDAILLAILNAPTSEGGFSPAAVAKHKFEWDASFWELWHFAIGNKIGPNTTPDQIVGSPANLCKFIKLMKKHKSDSLKNSRHQEDVQEANLFCDRLQDDDGLMIKRTAHGMDHDFSWAVLFNYLDFKRANRSATDDAFQSGDRPDPITDEQAAQLAEKLSKLFVNWDEKGLGKRVKIMNKVAKVIDDKTVWVEDKARIMENIDRTRFFATRKLSDVGYKWLVRSIMGSEPREQMVAALNESHTRYQPIKKIVTGYYHPSQTLFNPEDDMWEDVAKDVLSNAKSYDDGEVLNHKVTANNIEDYLAEMYDYARYGFKEAEPNAGNPAGFCKFMELVKQSEIYNDLTTKYEELQELKLENGLLTGQDWWTSKAIFYDLGKSLAKWEDWCSQLENGVFS